MAAGILVLVPLIITYWILGILFRNIDGILASAVERAYGRHIPGLGILALIVLIYVVGLFGRNVLGRRIVQFGQKALLRVPVIRAIYSPSKQLIESFAGDGATGFKRVVIIEYPRHETWAIGFLTGVTTDESGKSLAVIYIPTAPTPNSGWVAILPASDVYDTDMTVSEAMSMVLSGGIITPPQINKVKSP